MAWHSAARALVLAGFSVFRSHLALFFTRPVIITYDSTGHLQVQEKSVPVCRAHPGDEEGRKSRGGRNNRAAAVAHPPLHYTHGQTST